ncbi:MAG: chitobiase/beta-hexosaminidase C-terminal domain-containing protein [Lachnospiraceae bacterium]|nr:chitobiase/beta-hexosaminidase C-terminal domain-containing protein [Lachnospiraceae bacterium]
MKCPHCGNELKEGYLICEKCGEEIQIVPDFEPEIENSITETLSTLAALQEGEDTQAKSREDEETGKNDLQEPAVTAEDGRKIWVAVSLIVILIVALISYGAYAYHVRTIDYRISKAREYAANGSYAEAIDCLEKAYEDYPDVAQILFLEADYYYLQQDNVLAVQVLYRIIERGDFSHEDLEEAYNKIITIYANQGLYGQINELLRNCPEIEIVNMFQSYLALEPEFSYVEGSYAEVIPLKLSSNTAGTIYYTMDGTKPTKNSLIYTAPIFLESGEYTISAFFINDYGIESEIVSKTYIINLSVPSAPEIALYSGEYTEPMMIAVEEIEGCKVYYTTDESDPTVDSVPYTGPIPMPLGKTLFKFVNISDEGVSSEITTRTYVLTLRGAIPTSQAVSNLVTRLVETGYLEDAEGHNKRQSGTLSYRFSSVLRTNDGTDYYTINEYYDDGTGVQSRTDKVFLVNIYTGEAAQLGYDDDGRFMAVII